MRHVKQQLLVQVSPKGAVSDGQGPATCIFGERHQLPPYTRDIFNLRVGWRAEFLEQGGSHSPQRCVVTNCGDDLTYFILYSLQHSIWHKDLSPRLRSTGQDRYSPTPYRMIGRRAIPDDPQPSQQNYAARVQGRRGEEEAEAIM